MGPPRRIHEMGKIKIKNSTVEITQKNILNFLEYFSISRSLREKIRKNGSAVIIPVH
jgi:hypothetical protein